MRSTADVLFALKHAVGISGASAQPMDVPEISMTARSMSKRTSPGAYSCQTLFPLGLSHHLHSLVLFAPIDAFWVPPYIRIGMHTTSLHDAPGHVKGRRHHSILRQMPPGAAAARSYAWIMLGAWAFLCRHRLSRRCCLRWLHSCYIVTVSTSAIVTYHHDQ